jgi:thiopeptide-type bacteriocin biosynthesis protein
VHEQPYSVRGHRLVLPSGSGRVEIRRTAAVRHIEHAARSVTAFSTLFDSLAGEFPDVAAPVIETMLAQLVEQRYLVTSLRAPGTVTDPLGYVIDQLTAAGADDVAPSAAVLQELRSIRAGLERLERAASHEREAVRTSLLQRMQDLSQASRSPLAVELRLACDVTLPHRVADEMQAAASALLRLTARPTGPLVWRDYYAAFLDRYGTGTLVPLTDVVDPDTGLGLPYGYPGSAFTAPSPPSAREQERDARLLRLAQRAFLDGTGEVTLDDVTISDLAAGGMAGARIPPHVEISARISAVSTCALDRGDYTLTVSPARAAGTMTGRFTSASDDMAEVFAHLPTSTVGAIPAQVCVPPAYPHAENISRTPRFLPHIVALGESRAPDDGVIPLDDLAVTADRHQLYLVSVSRQQVVEPVVFHGLALDKQPPPLARFLVNLPRGFTSAYTEFDWGSAASLPHVPRVRYRRSVLSPARWRLEAADLPAPGSEWPVWRSALERWRRTWQLPDTVEMRDQDRVLRLDLTTPAHCAILRAQVELAGDAVLVEATDPAGLGWLGGHAHEVAVPMISARQASPSPMVNGRDLPLIGNDRGHLPGAAGSGWSYAKIYVCPERQTEVLADHLPRLLTNLDRSPPWWFLRYRSPHDEDHLRLRIRVAGREHHGGVVTAVGTWAEELRQEGIIRRLVFDTYDPEVGRYGDGAVMAAAENVFTADSRALLTQWTHITGNAAEPRALAAAHLVDTVVAFAGSIEHGMGWLIDHPHDPPQQPLPRHVTAQGIVLSDPEEDFAHLRRLPGGPVLLSAWHERRTALAAYRSMLPSTADTDSVLESLLHMHHIRALGIDRDGERACRRLARSAALSWRARKEQG